MIGGNVLLVVASVPDLSNGLRGKSQSSFFSFAFCFQRGVLALTMN